MLCNPKDLEMNKKLHCVIYTNWAIQLSFQGQTNRVNLDIQPLTNQKSVFVDQFGKLSGDLLNLCLTVIFGKKKKWDFDT